MFSLYDEGIWTTDDSWFEVTHESIARFANHPSPCFRLTWCRTIADHVAAARPSNKPIMLDCFAGVGGNAIAFALSGAFRRVYAIEKNEAALACARHNASIYGVLDKITFFHGDCFDILGLNGVKPGVTVDVLSKVISQAGIIFASPPWGGESLSFLAAGKKSNIDRTWIQERRRCVRPRFNALFARVYVLTLCADHQKHCALPAEDKRPESNCEVRGRQLQGTDCSLLHT